MSMIGLIPRAGLAQRRGRPGKRLILGGGFAALLVALTMANTAIAPYDPLDGDIMMRLKPMFTPAHWMGTDQLGRDLWSRVLAGLPWSLGIATVATLISMVIGTVAGLTAAWQPGRLRTLVNRLVDHRISRSGNRYLFDRRRGTRFLASGDHSWDSDLAVLRPGRLCGGAQLNET